MFGILGATRALGADGAEIGLGGTRRRALLVMLALDAGRVVGVERLIDGLYGEESPSGVGNAVQSQVSRLRQVLPVAVEGRPGGYRLVVGPDQVDAHRFERLVAEGRGALAAGEAGRAGELLREGLGLWRGPALADVRDAPFAAAQVVRLEELRVGAIEERLEADLALGRHRAVVPELGELVAAHPLRERLRGQLMRALYGSGRQSEALKAYETARRELAESLGADPGPELAAVHLAVLRGDPELTRAAGVPRGTPAVLPVSRETSPTAPRHQLPAVLTSFIGRDQELDRLGRQLERGRMVTLTGPGGAGKTRLAVEAAGRCAHDATFVELVGLTDGAELPRAVLGALGLREASLLAAAAGPGTAHTSDPVARVAAALEGRPHLLVLDNCEHLVEDAALLAERLLAGCPSLRIMATSREALGIPGEELCPLPTLALPAPGTGREQVLASPAVRLFTERAAAVRPDFDPTADSGTVDAVLRLCTALDGLPLAIELAAARLRSLSVAEIAARLGALPEDPASYSMGVHPDAFFRLLSRGSRTALPRQRTLRGVVDWSWGLLPDDERAVLRRASVFAGGWTLSAAETVCADGQGIAPDDVLDLMAALVEKSLVVAQQPEGAGPVRYRMLESIRAYGAERLAEAGESGATRRAHSGYFLDLALEADPHLRRVEQLEWLRLLSDDRDNFQAALHRSLNAGETATAMRLIAALSSYWLLRGIRHDGALAARQVLDAIGPNPPPDMAEEYALCVLAVVGTLSDAEGFTEHVAAATRVVEGMHRLARRFPVLTVLWAPFAGVPRDEETQTLALLEEFLSGVDDPWYRALSQLGFGFQAWMVAADAELAQRECSASFDGFRRTGDRWGMITCLNVLADLADYRGEPHEAEHLLSRAMVLAQELDSALDVAELLCNRAVHSLRAGDLRTAAEQCEQAAELARRSGAPERLALAHLGMAEAARLGGELSRAHDLCEQALAECPTGWFSGDATRSSVLVAQARLAVEEGKPAAARSCFRDAVEETVTVQFPLVGSIAAEAAAGLALLEGDPHRAAALLGAAKALRGSPPPGPDAAASEKAARRALGDAAYDRAVADTAGLGRGEALAVLTDYVNGP